MSELLAALRGIEQVLEDDYCTSPPGLQPLDAPLVIAMVGFIDKVAATGAHADENSLLDPNVRTDLQAIIDVWCRRLKALTGRPFTAPDLYDFQRPDLEPMHPMELVRRIREQAQLDGPARAVSGRKFVYPVDDRPVDPRNDQRLHGCDFRQFGLIDCRFEELDLRGARFGPESILTRTWFEHCTLDGIESTVGPDDDLVGGMEGGLRASSCVFKRCTFAGASLMGTSFSYCEFDDLEIGIEKRDADLRSAVFTASTFKAAQFRAKLDNAVFTDCDLSGAKFELGSLEATVFSECDLTAADFSGAVLDGAIFSNCTLEGASFGPVQRRGQRLKATDLQNVDLRRCRNLTPEQLRTAKLNEWTLLPEDIVDDVKAMQPSWKPYVDPLVME